ncbi:MAG: PhoH family protein [Oxalobacter sp.]|nr:PhoH family protein [Oxalobacter sp.]
MSSPSQDPLNTLHYSPEPPDNGRLSNLCGPLDENLRQISSALDVDIIRRGSNFILKGKNASIAQQILEDFYAASDQPIQLNDIQLALVEHRAMTKHLAAGMSATELVEAEMTNPVLKTRRTDLRGRTPRQVGYLKAILEHDITFGIGPAGTGKTYLAVACAVDAMERDAVQRIILTRPAVEAGERLGFLPGDLAQKVDPYLRPLYDALYDLLGFERTQKCFEKQTIEIAPLAYMRGRTLNHAFIILDEAQNTTPEQMKMFLTRIGFGSRAVVTGDVTQIDLQHNQRSGLVDAMHILKDVRGIAFSTFNSADVVRHPLVARIVDAYEHAEKRQATGKSKMDQKLPSDPTAGHTDDSNAVEGKAV